jgi:hypothetical protein
MSATQDWIQEQVEAISRMTPRELIAWVSDHLAGRDIVLEDNSEDPPTYSIVALTRHLRPVVTQAIHLAVEELVHAWLDRDRHSEAENLLLLVQGLHVVGVRDDFEMLARGEGFRHLSANMQYRVLQTLIALNANVEPSFWYRVFEGNPNKLGGIAFDGLALVSPNHAIDFLSIVSDNPSIVEQIRIALPAFMDDVVPAQERARIRTLIEARIAEMRPSLARALTEFFAAEGTPLSVLPLVSEMKARKTKQHFPISPENFPALASIKEGLGRLFGFGVENPAKMFANLAHQ